MFKKLILSFNYTPQRNMLNIFKWNSSIKYLGILTKDTTKLFDSNYGPINKIIKSDIDRWSQLPLEMHNIIDKIQINMFPHLLYLFQSLPVEVPLKQFRERDVDFKIFLEG